MPPLLTLFTAPKPFTNPHIDIIQRNALRSWQSLGEAVEVVLIGDEEGMAEAAADLNLRQIKQVRTNQNKTPLLSSIFDLGRSINQSPFLVYVNADIILFPSVLAALHVTAEQFSKYLIVSQRWDLDLKEQLAFDGQWHDQLLKTVHSQGKLHARAGSDIFIYPRACFETIPDFAVGRAGWDNWMIYNARLQRWPVVDITQATDIVHQNHDYSHLPGGQPHYKLPETAVNVALAGGKKTVFTLDDVSHEVRNGQVRPVKKTVNRILREIEIFPIIRLRSRILNAMSYAIFHPRDAYGDLRAWLAGSSKSDKEGRSK